MAALENPGYLVSTEWLADHLNDTALRILDVTAMLTADLTNVAESKCFADGHIPGAVFFDVASAKGRLSRSDADLPWSWPTPEEFAQTMSDFGITNEHRVVITARTPRDGIDSGTMWCTRAWWTMHHFGVECAILEGGVEKWEAEARPMSTDASPGFPPTEFEVDPQWQRGYANKEDVLAALNDADTCVVDALPEESYAGSGSGYGRRKGHITGAVSRPFRNLLTSETAAFRPADELSEQHGDVFKKPKIVTYCGGAIAATVNAFTLRLLGHHGVAVYDGSLMEWSSDSDLPMTDPSANGNQ